MSGAADIGKCNSFAMEKMKAKAEEDRLEKMHTKQKAGTPTVRTLLGSIYLSLHYIDPFDAVHYYQSVISERYKPAATSVSMVDAYFG